MKKIIIAAILPWLLTIFGQKAMAQETPKAIEKKETQEIVIRKKGDKDVTINLQITGDKVMVNGKPLLEFSDDAITINKKKIVIGERMNFDIDHLNFDDFDVNDIRDVTVRGYGAQKGANITVNGYPTFNNRPFLGVSTEKNDAGAKIITVTKESGAEAAGLKTDDIITKINDTKVTGPEDLFEAISQLKVKDEVKVSYKRGTDKEKTVKATLKENKGPGVKTMTITSSDGTTKTVTVPDIARVPGMNWNNDNRSFNSLMLKGRPKFGIKIQDTEEENGVKILDVDNESPAATAGIQKDDILTEINGTKITNTDDAREQMQVNSEKNNYPVKVKRSGKEMTLTIKIPKKLKTTNL